MLMETHPCLYLLICALSGWTLWTPSAGLPHPQNDTWAQAVEGRGRVTGRRSRGSPSVYSLPLPCQCSLAIAAFSTYGHSSYRSPSTRVTDSFCYILTRMPPLVLSVLGVICGHNGPPKMTHSNPWNLWIGYITWLQCGPLKIGRLSWIIQVGPI